MNQHPATPSRRRQMRKAVASALTLATLAGVAGLTGLVNPTAAGALPRQGIDTPPPVTVRPPVTTRPRPTLPTVQFGSPMYKIEALSFTADDESGLDFTGSDEPMFVFTSTNGTQTGTVRSQEFGDVDSGDTLAFAPGGLCVSGDCVRGQRGPLSLSVQLMEMDQGDPERIRAIIKDGLAVIGYAAMAFGQPAPNVDKRIQDYFVGVFADDLMGSQTLVWSEAELAAAMPAPGTSYIETVHLGEHGGDLPDFIDNPPDYTLRLKITRMANDGGFRAAA